MLFLALERVHNLDGDLWQSVFDQEMLDWFDSYWAAMDPSERSDWEAHRDMTKLLKQIREEASVES